jgi:hypothetical protein
MCSSFYSSEVKLNIYLYLNSIKEVVIFIHISVHVIFIIFIKTGNGGNLLPQNI